MAAKKKKKAKSSRAKTPGKTPGTELVPQPHGGALKTGGNPGNKGGGRPKSEVRAAALEGADVAIPFLKSVVEDAIAAKAKLKSKDALDILGLGSSKKDAIAASKVLLQFGLGTQTEVSVDDIKSRLTRQLQVLREELPVDLLEKLLPRLRVIWTGS